MKAMYHLNVKKLEAEYNAAADVHGAEMITSGRIYEALQLSVNYELFGFLTPVYVLLTPSEFEKFAELLSVDTWSKLAIEHSATPFLM